METRSWSDCRRRERPLHSKRVRRVRYPMRTTQQRVRDDQVAFSRTYNPDSFARLRKESRVDAAGRQCKNRISCWVRGAARLRPAPHWVCLLTWLACDIRNPRARFRTRPSCAIRRSLLIRRNLCKFARTPARHAGALRSFATASLDLSTM